MSKTIKYTVAALAVMMIGASAFAQSGAVYSLNVVGFQKVGVEATGLTLSGMPFDPEDNELNAVIGDQLTGAKNIFGADRVYLWDTVSQSYKKYYLKNNLGNQWVSTEDPTVPTTNAFLDFGAGFWIDSPGTTPQEVVIVGDVVNDLAVTNDISTGLNLLSFPFSTEVAINEMGLTNGTAAKNIFGADRVFAWDKTAQQYVKFYMKSNLGNQWVSIDDTTVAATNIIDPSQGIWYEAMNPFTWTALRPYTLD
ncbi:MAG: hypothetical protein EOM12_13685 [Verrucomicrobiae bacterium]|nr:hypothetical protein [Verrucomicrobiae bacterium]